MARKKKEAEITMPNASSQKQIGDVIELIDVLSAHIDKTRLISCLNLSLRKGAHLLVIDQQTQSLLSKKNPADAIQAFAEKIRLSLSNGRKHDLIRHVDEALARCVKPRQASFEVVQKITIEDFKKKSCKVVVIRLGDISLGDFFAQCNLGRFGILNELGDDQTAFVYVKAFNPAILEFFDLHPKRNQIKIVQDSRVDVKRHMREGAMYLREIEMPLEQKFKFFEKSEEREIVESYKDAIVIQASAGESYRSIPADIVHRIVEILRKEIKLNIVAIGRDYERVSGRDGTMRSETDMNINGVVNLVNRLSGPGSAQVIINARAVVTSHSAATMLAGYLQKPQLLLYPNSMADEKYFENDGNALWSFMAKHDNVYHASFQDWSIAKTKEWIAKYVA